MEKGLNGESLMMNEVLTDIMHWLFVGLAILVIAAVVQIIYITIKDWNK